MFNHSYGAAVLADRHRRELQHDAARSRLIRQAKTKPVRRRPTQREAIMFPPTLADMLYAANKAEMRQRALDAELRQRALDAEQSRLTTDGHEARHRRARTHPASGRHWPHWLTSTFGRTQRHTT
jgi:hypothetical protein